VTTVNVRANAQAAVAVSKAASVSVATSVQGPKGSTGAPGVSAVFTMQDTLTPYVGKSRFYFDANRTITQVRASVGTTPSGSPITLAVYVNGVSLGTLTITAGTYTATLSTSQTVTAADYATVSVLTVGNNTPGTDLTVTLTIS